MPIEQAYAGGAVETQDEGVVVQSATTSFDFVGTGVTVTDAGGGQVTVTVPAGGAAIDTVFGRIGTVVAVSGDYTGAQVTFTPAGDLTATEIQAAIEEARRLVLGRSPVDLATTGDITLSGEQTIDGTLTSASRVLVKDQATGSENGVYLTAAGAWVRAVDFDSDNEAFAGINYYIEGGTLGAKRTFFLVTTGAIVLDTTALVFEEAPASTVAASDVTNTPAGDIVATDVQAAINELDADKLATAIFDANTILAADTDDTPAAVTIGASELVGRTAAGNIAGLTATLVRTILNVADGADVSPVASVFTRTGAVVAASGDYNAGQVTFTPVDDLVGTNVQAVLDELRQKDLFKNTVDLATTGSDITLTGEQTIDGTATSASRVMVKDQALGQENGVYVSAAGPWVRASDMDQDDEAKAGLSFYVEGGTLNAKKVFTLTTTGAITLDTTPVVFEDLFTSGGATIVTQDEGVLVDATATTLNFAGLGVVVTDSGSGVSLITISGGATPQMIEFDIRNQTGTLITKGTPVFQTGFSSGQSRITVDVADAAGAATMIALGLAVTDIANNANGTAIPIGILTNVDTTAFAVNDALFVAAGGGLTNVEPTGTALKQKVAHVLNSNVNGELLSLIDSEVRAFPNIPLDNIIVGGVSAAATELPIAASGMIGRAVGAALSSLTPAEVLTNISVESGADVTDDANVRAALAAATADVSVNSRKITSLADGVGANDAINKSQLDAATGANAVINGGFDFSQRALSFVTPGSLAYTLDRFQVIHDGTIGVFTVSQQVFTLGQTDVPGEPEFFFRWDHTTAGSGSTFRAARQKIEDVRTFAGETVTLSVYAKADSARVVTPTLQQDFGTGGSPSAPVTLSGAVMNLTTTFQRFTRTFTLGSLSGKTLGTNSDDTLIVQFALPINTVMTIDFADLQLELGATVSDFQKRPFAVELELVQRFFEKSYNIGVAPGSISDPGALNYQTVNVVGGGLFYRTQIGFATRKITVPTVTLFSTVTGTSGQVRNVSLGADAAGNADLPGEKGFSISLPVDPSNGAIIRAQWTADSES